MRFKVCMGLFAAAWVALTFHGASRLEAQGNGIALTGTVTSQAKSRMEGVVVTARGDGANFSDSVASNAQGQFTFPRTHLQQQVRQRVEARAQVQHALYRVSA